MTRLIQRKIVLIWSLVAILLLQYNAAVDRSNFKKCSDEKFCTTQRQFKPEKTPYLIDNRSLSMRSDAFEGVILREDNDDKLSLKVRHLSTGAFRVEINEISPEASRFTIPEGDVILKDLKYSKLGYSSKEDGKVDVHGHADDKALDRLVITLSPFRMEVFREHKPLFVINADNMFLFETQHAATVAKQNDPSIDWSETFKGHTDTKKKGPNSVGMDITILDKEYVFGIPEHADSFALRDTANIDPYRLYNLDVFAYELSETMALYGSVPFMLAHAPKSTVGLFWNNPTETWIDIASSRAANSGIFSSLFLPNDGSKWVRTHWMSESGTIDLFLFTGPTPHDVSKQYAAVTGTTPLPPLFSLAYHQCRWNYRDQPDVMSLDTNFDKYRIPADVFWLDIEHTDGKRYFTWDSGKFPNPGEMVDRLLDKQRKLVTVVDPHIKSDSNWNIYNDAKSADLFVKDASNAEYSGWCWPGSSAYPDFTAPQTRKWWSDQFISYEPKRVNTMYTWNDMGEPSVFSGPEVTMQKDTLHLNGHEHRELHNIYGLHVHAATFEGQLQRSASERPFVLTRAFYAGSQRTSAVWTGDNAAEWSHLKVTIPMLLSMSVAGINFCGADVGGFFNNPDVELLTRWYQAGAYQPFFRAHAHLDTTRREPWLFPEETTNRLRAAVESRYALLPYWYVLFAMSEKDASPPMAPLWYHFPEQVDLYTIETEYLLGDSILVAPALDQGVNSVKVTFPNNSTWYQFPEWQMFAGGQTTSVSATIDQVPVFYRDGRIVVRRERMRRSSGMMAHDPYTLIVTLAADGHSSSTGYIYEDDYETIKDPKRALFKVHFDRVKSQPNQYQMYLEWVEGGVKSRDTEIERVIVIGLDREPQSCTVDSKPITCRFEKTHLEIKKPAVALNSYWKLTIS